MLTSGDRMLTTHAGSLPRPPALEASLIKRERGGDFEQAEFAQAVAEAIDWVVARQVESGVDIGNDGEESRVGFQTYVPQRMSGFGGESQRKMLTDMVKFPGYAAMFTERTWSRDKERPKVWNAPQAKTAVVYEPDLADVNFELAQFEASLERAGGPFAETFMTDRRLARHRLHHHAARGRQPGLPARRGLRDGARPRDEEGVRLHRRLGPPAADRRA